MSFCLLFHDYATRGARALCILAGLVLLFVMGIGTAIDVVLRNFNYGIPGMWEVVTFAMRWMIGLALPYAFCTGAHIVIEMFTDALPRAGRQFFVALASLVSLGVISVFAWRVVVRTIAIHATGGTTSDLGMPTFLAWTPLAVGLILSVPAILSVAVKECYLLVAKHND